MTLGCTMTCVELENLQWASAYCALSAFVKSGEFECCHTPRWTKLQEQFMACFKQLDFTIYRASLPENHTEYLDAFSNASNPAEILKRLHRDLKDDDDVDLELEVLDKVVFVVESQICIILEHLAK
jgi:hypothetical protein